MVAQIEGGIVYGLGLAILERITIKDGIVEQTNFSDYPVPRMRHTPAMHVELIPSDNLPVGVGQTSVPLVAPAVGNAVAQLTDIRLRQLPMSPERVKTALG
jgi:isoquinoline 1-oxidoreductase beta subunit